MKIEPIERCINALKAEREYDEVILRLRTVNSLISLWPIRYLSQKSHYPLRTFQGD